MRFCCKKGGLIGLEDLLAPLSGFFFTHRASTAVYAPESAAPLMQRQHDFTASAPLNYHGDSICWRRSWCGEAW